MMDSSNVNNNTDGKISETKANNNITKIGGEEGSLDEEGEKEEGEANNDRSASINEEIKADTASKKENSNLTQVLSIIREFLNRF